MAHNQRIEDLRRRVQRDPASIAFAQLGEELRRAGELPEAVETCRAGLQIHPTYLSARVTLGRALLDLDQLDDAERELRLVLKSAPDNLAAMRGLGEIHHRRGSLGEALAQFRSALSLAPNDPDLRQTVNDLAHRLAPEGSDSGEGLSFNDVQSEFLKHASPLLPPAVTPQSEILPQRDGPPETHSAPEPFDDPQRENALRQIAALEQWLDAIHVLRAHRSA